MKVRAATVEDALAMAQIYSAGIAERVATFETLPRSAEDILPWFKSGLPLVVVEAEGQVIAFAVSFAYSSRAAYRTVAEFSVYVDASFRGKGAGKAAMTGLIDAARMAGLHKLTSRIFVENLPSLRLMESLGFRSIGVQEKHGKLDGQWRDVVTVELLIPENL